MEQASFLRALLFLLLSSHHVCGNVSTDDVGRISIGASNMEVVSLTTVSEDMFLTSGGSDEDTKIRFGFAQITEIGESGNEIQVTEHSCHFREDNIKCRASGEESGVLPAVNDLGEPTEARFTRVTKTCSLATCNSNPNAALVIRSYIMLNKAYLCLPDCEAENQYQSPVFNGTAKWDVEVSNWTFCESDTCGGETGEFLKIYFNVRGAKGDKEMRPKRKDRVPFDVENQRGKSAKKCREMEEVSNVAKRTAKTEPEDEEIETKGKGKPKEEKPGKEKTNRDDEHDDDEHDDDDGRNGKDNGKDHGKDNGWGNGKGNGKDKTSGKGGRKREKGDRSGKGKCRNSLSSSFGDEPDDQFEFSLSDEFGRPDQSVFRMFGVAVIDGTELAEEGSGFLGPFVENAEIAVGKSGQKIMRDYVTIQVKRFADKMVYDPTVDMDPTGGSNGDPENGTEPRNLALMVLFLNTILAMILQ